MMDRLLRGWLAILLLAIGQLALAQGVVVMTTSPAAPGRFADLEQAARALGLPLRARFVERIPAAEMTTGLWQGADLVLLDAPRQHIEDFMRDKLGAALPALQRYPHLWLPTAAPIDPAR